MIRGTETTQPRYDATTKLREIGSGPSALVNDALRAPALKVATSTRRFTSEFRVPSVLRRFGAAQFRSCVASVLRRYVRAL